MTKCMPVFEGVLLHFNIFYCSGALAMTHLSCCIIPLKFVSLPWHIQAINLLCLALTGLHWQMFPWHKHMSSIGPISWMWMRYTLGSQGMVRWWILYSASRHLQNSPQEMSFIFGHRLSTCCPPPRNDWHSCAALLLGSFAQACTCKISTNYQLIYPYYWVCLYAI